MLEFNIDTTAVVNKLSALQRRVDELSQTMPEQLTAWQAEDMNRSRPHTETPEDNTAVTLIYPRGRQLTALPGRRRVNLLPRRPGAQRPILRPELLDRLAQRMAELLRKTMRWA